MTGFFFATASREVPNVLLFTRDGTPVEEDCQFFEGVVNKRLKIADAEGFIEPQALRALIQKSGGVIREFIYLVQYADMEARRLRIERYKREKIKGLDSERLRFLFYMEVNGTGPIPSSRTSWRSNARKRANRVRNQHLSKSCLETSWNASKRPFR